MGVIVVIVASLLIVLGGLLGSSQESVQESRSAFIARQIMADLTSGTDTTGQLLLVSGSTPTPVNLILSSTVPYTNQVYYNLDGNAVTQGDPGAVFEADLELKAIDPVNRPGFNKMQVSVHAIQSGTMKRPFLFISQMAPKMTGTATGTNGN